MVDRLTHTANIERLERKMDSREIDVVVARSGINFTYLAGFEYSGTLARHLDLADSPRGVVAIWPRHREPALVLNRIAAPRAERDSAITTIYLVDEYQTSYVVRVAEALTDMGLGGARIGVEESFLSKRSWSQLSANLPGAELVDCTEMMHEVRWIKTEAEIELIRRAAKLLDQVYLEVLPFVRPGDTERQVHARIVGACLEKGATWAHGILNSNRNTVLYGGEGDLELKRGDVIRNDYVSWLHGYPGHQSRPAVVGSPNQSQLNDYETVRQIYQATIEAARPGVTGCDIYDFASRAFADAGIPGKIPLAGHGVGPWWHQQPPYLVPACDTPLEVGMVIAFEPHVNEYHLQEIFLIGEERNVNLSPTIASDAVLIAGVG